MIATLIFFFGYACGGMTIALAAFMLRHGRTSRRQSLPPATARQLKRAARANRLRLEEGDPRWVPIARGNFDHEDTR